ncbi:hypothetical protein [Sandaracinus amylolyticus]|uniref:hypothetical protein n=1 Tax=Sandaracinus amylolyticus TaxID=927083 RepID=UPI0012EEDED7|nr:hypothetical protein [Sandaracinus amylolyticus]
MPAIVESGIVESGIVESGIVESAVVIVDASFGPAGVVDVEPTVDPVAERKTAIAQPMSRATFVAGASVRAGVPRRALRAIRVADAGAGEDGEEKRGAEEEAVHA